MDNKEINFLINQIIQDNDAEILSKRVSEHDQFDDEVETENIQNQLDIGF